MINNKQETNISEEIKSILSELDNYKGIIIYPPGIDWNIPMFQRPQHIALSMSSKNWLYFYCTTNTYDKISGFHKIRNGCYLTDKYQEIINLIEKFAIIIPSAHPGFGIQEVINLKKKAIIIYDYLDDINPSIQVSVYGDKILERHMTHRYLIENSDMVLVTAEILYNEVKSIRQNNVHLIPNGVDYFHFHLKQESDKIPSQMQKIKNRGRPIIGYFGALATWFDYEMLRKVACSRPDLEFVLIGINYDGSIDKSRILDIVYQNIHYLGVKDYSELPRYAVWFDVCIIPFIVNQITHATSPIKLFEYMALGKPIVTTALNEVKKFKSVLIANNYDEFLEKIDLALKLQGDETYIKLLDSEARLNTWETRVNQFDIILDSKYKENNHNNI